MPAPSLPEYFTLLPSEICRLVLGYLIHNGCANAAEALFCESSYLAELRTQYVSVYDLPFHVTQVTLLDIVSDYLKVANAVAHHVFKLGITFRLGSVSTALPHLLKLPGVQPGVVRLAHIRPNRMPLGKPCLPPRIVNLEQLSRNFQLPSLAVRPHPCSAVSSVTTPPCTPNIVSVHSTTTIVNQSISPSSSSDPPASLPLTRPVIRLVRHSSLSSSNNCASVYQKVTNPSSPAEPTCSAESVMNVVAVHEHHELSADASRADDLEGTSVACYSQVITPCPSPDIPCKPSAATPIPACTPNTSPRVSAVSNSNIVSSDASDCTVSTSFTRHSVSPPPTNASSALFDIVQHLPPPTEGFVTAPLSPKPLSSASEFDRAPTASKRRRHRPRHITTVSVASEPKGHDGTEDDGDVDLQRFLSALLCNPEEVATHINAKIGAQTKNDCETVPLQPIESTVNRPSGNPFKHHPTVLSSVTCSTDLPTAVHDAPQMLPIPSVNSPNTAVTSERQEQLTNWLELCNLDGCIDHVLSQFDLSNLEPSKPTVGTETSTPTTSLDDAPTVIVPSDASTPTGPSLMESIDSLTDSVPEVVPTNITKQTPKKCKRPSRRRVASPLCLSQFADKVSQPISPPTKRRATSSKRKAKQLLTPSVLHTPEGKASVHSSSTQLSELESLQQTLFTSESTMKLYEEFVDVQVANSVRDSVASEAQYNSPSSSSFILKPIDHYSPLTQTNQPVHRQSPVQTTGFPDVSAFLSPVSSSGWPVSVVMNQSTATCSSQPVYSIPSAASTMATNSLQSVVQFSTAEGTVPQTIILCQSNDTMPLRLANWPATGSLLHSSDKPMLIRLHKSTNVLATSTSTDPVAGCVPVSTHWTEVAKFVLPANVDLDSPNPYQHVLDPVRCRGSVENLPPLIVNSGSQRKVLNLASMDVDEILSRSLEAKR